MGLCEYIYFLVSFFHPLLGLLCSRLTFNEVPVSMEVPIVRVFVCACACARACRNTYTGPHKFVSQSVEDESCNIFEFQDLDMKDYGAVLIRSFCHL